MKTLKITAIIVFILACLSVIFVNTSANANAYVTQSSNTTIRYERVTIAGKSYVIFRYVDDIEICN
jgi:hypothetical protein